MIGYKPLPEEMTTFEDLSTVISYVIAFLMVWFFFHYLARFLISIIWPMIIVLFAVYLIRFLLVFEPIDGIDIFFQATALVIGTIFKLCNHAMTYCNIKVNVLWNMVWNILCISQ